MYFTRPNDDVVLRSLSDQSADIAEAASKAPPEKYNPGATANEWLTRRVKSQRATNYKVWLTSSNRISCGSDCVHCMQGPESWKDRRGTEDITVVPHIKI